MLVHTNKEYKRSKKKEKKDKKANAGRLEGDW